MPDLSVLIAAGEPPVDNRRALSIERQRRYRARHPEKALESARKYREAHPERIREIQARYRARHAEAIRKRRAQYRGKEEVRRRRRARDRAKYRENGLHKVRHWRYGLEAQDVEDMFNAQGGVCPGCNERFGKTPHLDHDHATGKVRGLLCGGCNLALGCVRDSAETMRRLADYIGERGGGHA